MKDIALPLLTLVLGGMIGLVASILASLIAHRRTIALRLLDQFFEVRKELVDVVSDLSNLTSIEDFGESHRASRRDAVAKLYYKHFDFLPGPVLDALVLLRVALAKPAFGPYSLRQGTIAPMNDPDIIPFVERCSLFENAKAFALIALNSKQQEVRENEAVKLHARYVLYTLKKYASIDDLSALTKKLKKLS